MSAIEHGGAIRSAHLPDLLAKKSRSTVSCPIFACSHRWRSRSARSDRWRAWRKLAIETPNEREILDVTVQGNLRRQSLTELFFDSDEPSFDELSPEEFFDRFPEGLYEIEGTTIEGDELESPAELTHVLPAPADNILVSGVPAAEDCDAIPLPSVGPPLPFYLENAAPG